MWWKTKKNKNSNNNINGVLPSVINPINGKLPSCGSVMYYSAIDAVAYEKWKKEADRIQRNKLRKEKITNLDKITNKEFLWK